MSHLLANNLDAENAGKPMSKIAVQAPAPFVKTMHSLALADMYMSYFLSVSE